MIIMHSIHHFTYISYEHTQNLKRKKKRISLYFILKKSVTLQTF